MRELERGVQGDSCGANTLLRGGHPLDGVRGGRECESRAGEGKDVVDVEDEEKGKCRFLREKDCSA